LAHPATATRGWARRLLTVAIALVLAVALVALGVQLGSSRLGDSDRGVDSESGGDGGGGQGVAGQPAGGAPSAPPPMLEATARSVAFQGTIGQLTSVRLAGASTASFSGKVADGTGKTLGDGFVDASGGEMTVSGTRLLVDAADGELHLAGSDARFLGFGAASDLVLVRGSGRLTLDAPSITFRPDKGRAVPVTGPLTFELRDDRGVVFRAQGDLTWLDPPPVLRLTGTARHRTTLSWAGEGVVRAAGREHRAVHLGVKASRLDATLERRGDGLAYVRGNASLLQAYVDGLPVLPGRGRVRVKAEPGKVPRGTRGWFTWAPENDGPTDMTILRIRPDNPEAAWVSLGLDRLPAMCGGEMCEPRGGDTTGFTRGKGINSVIVPGTGDERGISFRVPHDAALGMHQLAIVVEGNFDPIRVVVEFEVVESPPPSTSSR
jgi:hypothetical protein